MQIKKVSKRFSSKLLKSGEGSNYRPLGKFYLEENGLFIGIDNETGEAWVEEFETLESCIDWLNSNEYECWNCGRIDNPTISVHFEFEDGSDYDELLDSEEVVDIEEWIKKTIDEKGWTNIKDYSYGLFCPSCLESLE